MKITLWLPGSKTPFVDREAIPPGATYTSTGGGYVDLPSWQRVVDWPAVPRVGDRVEIGDGGWSETVDTVWWKCDPADDEPIVYVELSPVGTPPDLAGCQQTLRDTGWTER